jgi:hypothetical protein
MPSEIGSGRSGKIMLIGSDDKEIVARRLRAAGRQVIIVADNQAALDHARHEIFDATVLVSKGSLINVAETIFNLRDLNGSMEIIVVVNRLGKHTSRWLRQMMEHPIQGTRILTRRQLQKELYGEGRPAPPGASA